MSIGRNDPCYCGSGKKYKRCCLEKDQAAEREARRAVAQETEELEAEGLQRIVEGPDEVGERHVYLNRTDGIEVCYVCHKPLLDLEEGDPGLTTAAYEGTYVVVDDLVYHVHDECEDKGREMLLPPGE